MTASNGGIPSDEIKNYFNSIQSPFPSPVDDKVNTLQFLEASRGVVSLIDQFGSVFAPVKFDMNGNIEKLMQVYNLDQEQNSYLNDMVLKERAGAGILATDALLWLRRALNLIQRFFELILDDNSRAGGTTEELVVFLRTAYKETLNDYHSWHLQVLFSLLCRMCPNRSKFFQVVSLNQAHTEAAVYRDMAAFTASLREVVSTLAKFYLGHDLECIIKV